MRPHHVALALLAACQPRPPEPDSAPARRADDLSRYVCEHTSWAATAPHQTAMRAQEDEGDRVFAEHARLRRSDSATHLVVEIIDGYAWLSPPAQEPGRVTSFGCQGIAPHHVEVLLDGVRRGTLDVPCMEGSRTPARTWALPGFDVPPGLHRIRVRELVNGVSTARDMMFPDDNHPILEVYASESQFAIQDLSEPMIRM